MSPGGKCRNSRWDHVEMIIVLFQTRPPSRKKVQTVPMIRIRRKATKHHVSRPTKEKTERPRYGVRGWNMRQTQKTHGVYRQKDESQRKTGRGLRVHRSVAGWQDDSGYPSEGLHRRSGQHITPENVPRAVPGEN